MYLSGIPAEEVEMNWEECLPFIELGNNKSQEEYSLEDIKKSCIAEDMQIWVVFNDEREIHAVVTTQIQVYPNKKAGRIVTLGGRGFDDWVDLIETIEEWAKEMGCNSVEMFCRKGFIKKLGSRGYGEIYTVLGKELTTLH